MTTTSNSAFSIENTKVQMRKGILEFCILGIISKDEVYTSDILDALKCQYAGGGRHGISIAYV